MPNVLIRDVPAEDLELIRTAAAERGTGAQLEEFHRELTRQTRTIIFSVLGALVGLSGVALTLSRLV